MTAAGQARKVVVTDYNFHALEAEEAAAGAAGASFASRQCKDAEEVGDLVEGASAVFVQFAPMDAAAINRLADPAIIVRYGVGFDNIDIEATRARGVRVCYVPDYCIDEVADHTSSLLLALLRRLPILDRSVRSGEWAPALAARPLPPFDQTTVGFLGLGRIGQAVLTRLRPFGFRFVITDPRVDAERAAGFGAEAAPLADLWSSADAILLHAPSTPETRHIVNADSLSAMKPGVVLVNCARGDLIDETALADALDSGAVRAAGLDVFETEPLPDSSPLRAAPNLLLSPHAAWYSETSIGRLQKLAADEVTRFFNGDPPRCPVPDSI